MRIWIRTLAPGCVSEFLLYAGVVAAVHTAAAAAASIFTYAHVC